MSALVGTTSFAIIEDDIDLYERHKRGELDLEAMGLRLEDVFKSHNDGAWLYAVAGMLAVPF